MDTAAIERTLARLGEVEARLGDAAVIADRRLYRETLNDYRFLKKLDYAYCAWQLGEAQ